MHIHNFRYILSFVAKSRFFRKSQTLWYNVDLFHAVSSFTIRSSSNAEFPWGSGPSLVFAQQYPQLGKPQRTVGLALYPAEKAASHCVRGNVMLIKPNLTWHLKHVPCYEQCLKKHSRDSKHISMIKYLVDTSIFYFSTETSFLHVLLSNSRQFTMQSLTSFLVKTVAQIPGDMTFLVTQMVAVGVQSFWLYFKHSGTGTVLSLN